MNAIVKNPKDSDRSIAGLMKSYQSEIARALPRHMNADRMARVALTQCRTTPALMKCKPESLFGAIIQCSQLGLEPGNGLGHAYLLPYGQEVTLIIGYRGMIDLARRSGQIVSLEAHAVYQGDQFECTFGLDSTLKHQPDWQNPNRTNADRLQFVYAVAKLKDGGTQFEVMSRAEVDGIRARSRAGRSGPWVTDYAAMALKTVIRRLFKYLPVSIELQQAVALDEKVDANLSQEHEAVINGEASLIDENTPFGSEMVMEAQTVQAPEALPFCTDERFEENFPKWQTIIESGKNTAANLITILSSKYTLTEQQQDALRAVETAHQEQGQ